MRIRRRKANLHERSLDELKQYCRILFVDDDTDFKTINIIKQAGWTHTLLVNDIDNIDADCVRDAHIICLDIQGVGKALNFQKEGLGLLSALKSRYPHTAIIAYSAQSNGTIDCFDIDINKADKRLSKTTDPYQFMLTLEELAVDMLSYTQCSSKIKDVLESELGIKVADEEIMRMIKRLVGGASCFDVFKAFNLSNLSSIIQIVDFFIGK